jgi:hypothetical protein
MYFHQYPLDASFHKFVGPSINNDYVNLCIWSILKLLKIVHIGKYLILLRIGMKPILKVLLRKYISALSSFFIEYKHYKVVVMELDWGHVSNLNYSEYQRNIKNKVPIKVLKVEKNVPFVHNFFNG